MATWMLLAVALALTIAATPATASHLPECRPGTFLSKGRCEPCTDGTYLDKYSRAKSCQRHSPCKEDEEILGPGTPTSDTACQCLEGERVYSVYDFPFLEYKCNKCPRGTSAKRVIDGPNGDTACCPIGKVPRRDESGRRFCEATPGQSPTHPSNSHAPPADSHAPPADSHAPPADAQSTPQDDNGTHTGNNADIWRFDVCSFLIGAAVIAVVAAVAIACICLRLKTRKPYKVYKTMRRFFTRNSRQQSSDGQGASEGLRQQPDPESCV